MTLRILLIVALVGATWLGIAVSRRRVGRRSGVGLQPGLTLFVGPDCATCPRARDALEAEGAVLYDAVTAPDRRFHDFGVRSVPTALVADKHGGITMRRAGPAVISDATELVTEHRRHAVDPLDDPAPA